MERTLHGKKRTLGSLPGTWGAVGRLSECACSAPSCRTAVLAAKSLPIHPPVSHHHAGLSPHGPQASPQHPAPPAKPEQLLEARRREPGASPQARVSPSRGPGGPALRSAAMTPRPARPAELTEAGALGPLLTLPPPCVMWGEPFLAVGLSVPSEPRQPFGAAAVSQGRTFLWG